MTYGTDARLGATRKRTHDEPARTYRAAARGGRPGPAGRGDAGLADPGRAAQARAGPVGSDDPGCVCRLCAAVGRYRDRPPRALAGAGHRRADRYGHRHRRPGPVRRTTALVAHRTGLRRRRRLGAAAQRAGLAAVPPVRRQGAVTDVCHALADDLRAIGTDRTAETRRAVTAALNTAYDTLLTARALARTIAWTPATPPEPAPRTRRASAAGPCSTSFGADGSHGPSPSG